MTDEHAQEALKPVGNLSERGSSYQAVVGNVATIIASARDSAARPANAALTAAYLLIGQRVIEYEQSCRDRAA